MEERFVGFSAADVLGDGSAGHLGLRRRGDMGRHRDFGMRPIRVVMGRARFEKRQVSRGRSGLWPALQEGQCRQ